MKVIMHKQLNIDNRLIQMVKYNPQLESLTRAELISLCLDDIKKEATKNIQPIDVMNNVSIQKSNPSAIVLDTVTKSDSILVLPLLLSISDYSSFIKVLNKLDNKSHNKIGYYAGKVPYIANDFEVWKPKAMPTSIWGISSSNMSLAIDLNEHPINVILENIAQTIGYNGISSIFPQLSGIQFKSSRTIIERQEYYLSDYKILLY